MTGADLLSAAAAIMHLGDTAGYLELAPEFINLVLAETFEVNNRLMLAKGGAELDAIPSVSTLDEEIPYDEALSRLALPLGLVCRLYADEDNNAMLSLYKQEYALAVNAADRCVARF